jgi:hypothetical protein
MTYAAQKTIKAFSIYISIVTIKVLRILFNLSIVFKKKKIPRAMEGAVLQKRRLGYFKVKRIAHNVPAVTDVWGR